MKLTLHTPDYSQAWRLDLTPGQFSRVDNGRAISCGLMLGETVSPALLKRWEKNGQATPINPDVAKHSGCQSRCILRGDAVCQW